MHYLHIELLKLSAQIVSASFLFFRDIYQLNLICNIAANFSHHHSGLNLIQPYGLKAAMSRRAYVHPSSQLSSLEVC